MKKSFFDRLWLIMLVVLLTMTLGACVPGNATTEAPGPDNETTGTPDPGTTEAPTEEAAGAPTVEADYLVKLNDDSPLAGLPGYVYDSFSDYWEMGDGAEMLLFTAEDSVGYENYLTDLADAGYTLYAENEIAGNLYSTWVDDSLHVTMMYTPAVQQVRVLAEPASVALPGLESDNVYTDAGVENAVVQVGTYHTVEKNNGMCYVYRLCDGSFIIVDSGFRVEKCADALWDTLNRLAPDPENIVIAAWFITHAHNDHIGGFYTFTDTYGDQVTLERVIYNFPSKSSFFACDESGGTEHLRYFPGYVAKYGDIPIIEAHPGQKFYIRDAEIEMLYTWDIFSMKGVFYMNNTSLAFTVELADTKLMMLGDCGPLASPIMVDLYGDYLDSDFIQVSHHGNKGGTAELNAVINGEVVLWHSNQYNYDRFIDEDRNLLFASAEHLYVADVYGTMIPLPFDPDTVEKWQIYDTPYR